MNTARGLQANNSYCRCAAPEVQLSEGAHDLVAERVEGSLRAEGEHRALDRRHHGSEGHDAPLHLLVVRALLRLPHVEAVLQQGVKDAPDACERRTTAQHSTAQAWTGGMICGILHGTPAGEKMSRYERSKKMKILSAWMERMGRNEVLYVQGGVIFPCVWEDPSGVK